MQSNKDQIKMYGVTWCWQCRKARKFLEKYSINYDWINIDKDKDSEQFVIQMNNGYRSVPTIVFPDGSNLVEPTNKQLADKLGLT